MPLRASVACSVRLDPEGGKLHELKAGDFAFGEEKISSKHKHLAEKCLLLGLAKNTLWDLL